LTLENFHKTHSHKKAQKAQKFRASRVHPVPSRSYTFD
jgi:hypothetical protein